MPLNVGMLCVRLCYMFLRTHSQDSLDSTVGTFCTRTEVKKNLIGFVPERKQCIFYENCTCEYNIIGGVVHMLISYVYNIVVFNVIIHIIILIFFFFFKHQARFSLWYRAIFTFLFGRSMPFQF